MRGAGGVFVRRIWLFIICFSFLVVLCGLALADYYFIEKDYPWGISMEDVARQITKIEGNYPARNEQHNGICDVVNYGGSKEKWDIFVDYYFVDDSLKGAKYALGLKSPKAYDMIIRDLNQFYGKSQKRGKEKLLHYLEKLEPKSYHEDFSQVTGLYYWSTSDTVVCLAKTKQKDSIGLFFFSNEELDNTNAER